MQAWGGVVRVEPSANGCGRFRRSAAIVVAGGGITAGDRWDSAAGTNRSAVARPARAGSVRGTPCVNTIACGRPVQGSSSGMSKARSAPRPGPGRDCCGTAPVADRAPGHSPGNATCPGRFLLRRPQPHSRPARRTRASSCPGTNDTSTSRASRSRPKDSSGFAALPHYRVVLTTVSSSLPRRPHYLVVERAPPWMMHARHHARDNEQLVQHALVPDGCTRTDTAPSRPAW